VAVFDTRAESELPSRAARIKSGALLKEKTAIDAAPMAGEPVEAEKSSALPSAPQGKRAVDAPRAKGARGISEAIAPNHRSSHDLWLLLERLGFIRSVASGGLGAPLRDCCAMCTPSRAIPAATKSSAAVRSQGRAEPSIEALPNAPANAPKAAYESVRPAT
jgi:hypothetical protein